VIINTISKAIFRRDNMLRLIRSMTNASMIVMQDMMNISIERGGAMDDWTSYQIIFSPNGCACYLVCTYS
jgi:hypothetical protein